MLVGQRRTDDPDVRPLKRSIAWRAGDRIAGTLYSTAAGLGLAHLRFDRALGELFAGDACVTPLEGSS
jgi:hypothetical protein